MATRNFVATVKEGEVGQPCSLHFVLHEDIGLKTGADIVTLTLHEGTTIEDATRLKEILNSEIAKISIGG